MLQLILVLLMNKIEKNVLHCSGALFLYTFVYCGGFFYCLGQNTFCCEKKPILAMNGATSVALHTRMHTNTIQILEYLVEKILKQNFSRKSKPHSIELS